MNVSCCRTFALHVGEQRVQQEELLAVARSHWGDGSDGTSTGRDGKRQASTERAGSGRGLVEIRVVPARGFGKVLAVLKFLIFRRL